MSCKVQGHPSNFVLRKAVKLIIHLPVQLILIQLFTFHSIKMSLFDCFLLFLKGLILIFFVQLDCITGLY